MENLIVFIVRVLCVIVAVIMLCVYGIVYLTFLPFILTGKFIRFVAR